MALKFFFLTTWRLGRLVWPPSLTVLRPLCTHCELSAEPLALFRSLPSIVLSVFFPSMSMRELSVKQRKTHTHSSYGSFSVCEPHAAVAHSLFFMSTCIVRSSLSALGVFAEFREALRPNNRLIDRLNPPTHQLTEPTKRPSGRQAGRLVAWLPACLSVRKSGN